MSELEPSEHQADLPFHSDPNSVCLCVCACVRVGVGLAPPASSSGTPTTLPSSSQQPPQHFNPGAQSTHTHTTSLSLWRAQRQTVNELFLQPKQCGSVSKPATLQNSCSLLCYQFLFVWSTHPPQPHDHLRSTLANTSNFLLTNMKVILLLSINIAMRLDCLPFYIAK